MKKHLLILLLLSMLTGCGFHLRGLLHVPKHLNQMGIIQQQISPAFIKQLNTQLEANHLILTNPAKARYLLILEKDGIQQTLTNVSASTAPRQYQLTYFVQFQVTQSNGKILLPAQLISVQRYLTMNNDRILGSTFEMRTIEHEMHIEAANQMLSRLSFLPLS